MVLTTDLQPADTIFCSSFLWKHTCYVLFDDDSDGRVLYSFAIDSRNDNSSHSITFLHECCGPVRVFDAHTQPNFEPLLLIATDPGSSLDNSMFGQICTLSATHDLEFHYEHYSEGGTNPDYTCRHSRAFSSTGLFDLRIRSHLDLSKPSRISYALELAVRRIPTDSSTALPTWTTHELACPDKLELDDLVYGGLADRFRIDDHLGIVYLILRPGRIHTLSYS